MTFRIGERVRRVPYGMEHIDKNRVGTVMGFQRKHWRPKVYVLFDGSSVRQPVNQWQLRPE